MLAPLRELEILYRLLQGPLGAQLCQIAQEDSRLAQIRRAIGWMRGHYGEMLRIETLAEIAGMSEASFHRHFKAATAMSPLRSDEHTSELQSLTRISYAVFCLKKNQSTNPQR